MTARWLDLTEKALAIIVMLSFGGTVLPSLALTGGIPASNAEDPSAVLVFAVIYAMILGPMLLRPRLALAALTDNPVPTALIALALVSSVWSIEPEITLRRAVAFAFTSAFALHLGVRWPLRQVIGLFAVAFSIMTVLSLIFVVAVPSIGIDHDLHPGAWQGVYFQKNMTGRSCVWAVVCLLWLEHERAGARLLRRVMLAATLVLLAMSDSGTSLLTTALVFVLFAAHRWMRADVGLLALVLAAAALAGFLAFLGGSVFFDDTLALLGRDPTLTGRTELWDHAMGAIAERPILGWGYGAYWYGTDGPSSVFTVGWKITSAHNGWIDATIDLGLPGVLLVGVLVAGALIGGFRASRYGAYPEVGLFALVTAAATIVVSLSESVFLERHALMWVELIVANIALARARHPATAPLHREGYTRHDVLV